MKFTRKEFTSWFDDPNWRDRFSPLLTVEQAAELLGVPKGTVYDWTSRRELDHCKVPVGKHIRLVRDRLLDHFLNG